MHENQRQLIVYYVSNSARMRFKRNGYLPAVYLEDAKGSWRDNQAIKGNSKTFIYYFWIFKARGTSVMEVSTQRWRGEYRAGIDQDWRLPSILFFLFAPFFTCTIASLWPICCPRPMSALRLSDLAPLLVVPLTCEDMHLIPHLHKITFQYTFLQLPAVCFLLRTNFKPFMKVKNCKRNCLTYYSKHAY